MRVEPVSPTSTIQETWAPTLARLNAEETRTYGREKLPARESTAVQ
jgi:hypothetical protein